MVVTSPENYAFVMNIASLGVEKYILAPGHQLRRATRNEIAVIKERIEHLGGGGQDFFMHLWEERWPRQQGRIQILPEEEWRYFVIAFRGTNATLNDIQTALDLAPLELEVGFTVFSDIGGLPGRGTMFQGGRLFHVLEDARSSGILFVDVSESDAQDIRSICSQFQQSDNTVIDLKRLADQVGQLKGFPYQSPLRFLGYFAVLEALLTHTPGPGDRHDSITRQVKKKIALLDHRWTPKIDYGLFGDATAEKVWGKMYEYRSSLAHGGTADFKVKLKTLGNHERALKLVKETVKRVLRQALAEPRLVCDLREC